MPTMLTGNSIRDAALGSTFIQNGEVVSAEAVKYDLRLGSRILKASFGQPVDLTQLSAGERMGAFVEPGEMVFVLTMERLNLPEDMTAELSPKRKLSHAGIQCLGGFRIDPKYQGHLLVGLFNFSSTRFPLIPGKKLIAISFFRLQADEIGTFPDPGPPMDDFPEELIQTMERYRPVSIVSVRDALEKVRAELDALRAEIRSHDQWYRRFEESADRHDKQIGDLINGLNAEKDARIQSAAAERDARQAAEVRLSDQFKGFSQWQQGILVTVILAFAGVIITLFVVLMRR